MIASRAGGAPVMKTQKDRAILVDNLIEDQAARMGISGVQSQLYQAALFGTSATATIGQIRFMGFLSDSHAVLVTRQALGDTPQHQG